MAIVIEEDTIVTNRSNEITITFSETYSSIPAITFTFRPLKASIGIVKWHIQSITKTDCVLASSVNSGNTANVGVLNYKIIKRE